MNNSWKKTGVYLLIAIFAGLLILKGIVPAWNTINSDFANYYVSAKLLVDKVPLENLYDNVWFQKKILEYGIDTPGKFSPFPPVTACLMIPFTSFEPLVAQRIFTIINLFSIVLGVMVLNNLTSWSVSENVLLMLGCGLGVTNNIAFGQVYLIMVVFILISFLLTEKGYTFLPGILLGFFTSVKYFPIVIIAGFCLQGVSEVYMKNSWKSVSSNPSLRVVLCSFLSIGVFLLFQYFYFGKTVMSEFINSSFLPHLNGELRDQGLFSYQFQSWDNLFRNMFVYDANFNPHPLISWPAGRTISKMVVGIVVLILTCIVLYRYASFPTATRRAVFLSLPAVAALVFLPASATYHFVLMISSLVLILQKSILDKGIKTPILISYALIGLIPYGMFFSLSTTHGLLFAYPRLWLVSCLFLLVIAGLLKKTGSAHS